MDTSTVAAIYDPNTTQDIGGLLALAERAFQSGNWGLVFGLALTILVVAIRLTGLTKMIPKEYDKYVATGLAVLTSVAIGLQAGVVWWKIITSGVAIGFIAIGGWETIGVWIRDHITKPKPKPNAILTSAEDTKP